MIQGREAIEEFWRTVMASGVKEVELTTIELSGDGDFLHEKGTGILRVRPPGGTPAEQKIKFVVVWKRTAGRLEEPVGYLERFSLMRGAARPPDSPGIFRCPRATDTKRHAGPDHPAYEGRRKGMILQPWSL